MKRTPQFYSSPRRAQGAVLFVALIMLVLITLLGLTAASTSVLEEKMTGGMRNNQLSVLGAETAVRGAETKLWTLANSTGKFSCGYNGIGGCYATQSTVDGSGTGTMLVENPNVRAFRTSPTWLPLSSSGAAAYPVNLVGLSGPDQSASLAQQPQYMIEYLGLETPPGFGPPCIEGGSENRYRCTGGPGSMGTVLYDYRIIGRSTGGNNSTVRAVETYFGSGVPSL